MNPTDGDEKRLEEFKMQVLCNTSPCSYFGTFQCINCFLMRGLTVEDLLDSSGSNTGI